MFPEFLWTQKRRAPPVRKMSTKFRAEISVIGPIGEERVPRKRPNIQICFVIFRQIRCSCVHLK